MCKGKINEIKKNILFFENNKNYFTFWIIDLKSSKTWEKIEKLKILIPSQAS